MNLYMGGGQKAAHKGRSLHSQAKQYLIDKSIYWRTVSAGVSQGRVVKMTGVDEIINYQRHPDEDFYALLGCDENSNVSYLFNFCIF